jgi:LmbE family N-acetylglucosaminyl deacetylase
VTLRILRRAVRTLLPTRTRQLLDFLELSLNQATPPELVPVPTASSVLVLAPHPDDEVVGCGGTLYQHSRGGTKVTVVYMTDGRLGSLRLQGNALTGVERESFQAELIRVRKAEAAAAGRILGAGELIFLDFPDGDIRLSRNTVKPVAELLAARRPEVVYVPFPTDRQRDHVETARIFSAAVGEATNGCQVYAYEVWSPLYPNCMVDISDVVEVKRQALLQFAAQVVDNDFVHSILGLNAYRAIFHLRSRGYAEAFFRCSAREFRRLCRHLVGIFS